ncbi:MAG: ribonuclease HII [Pseudomonadota bacterium]
MHRLNYLPDYTHEIAILDGTNGHVAGCDEAGRGPLAGPVVAASVVLPVGMAVDGLDDSKALTAKRREALFDAIQANALAIGICSISAETIDRTNIRAASLAAMRNSLERIHIKPHAALFDGRDIPDGLANEIKTEAIIKGDAKSMSIAAASIIAKVTRDRMLVHLDDAHADYGFAAHKGYGSAKVHQSAIQTHGGVARVHRMSFAPFRQTKLL